MAKGEPKKSVFTVYLRYDGLFVSSPLRYAQGYMRELTDTNFDEMSYDNLLEIMKRLVPHGAFKRLYYCKTGDNLALGLREIKCDQDIVDMLTVGYENGNMIDMYVEHLDYDIMEMCELEQAEEQSIIDSSDENYSSDDCEEIDYVDFQAEGDESVVIKNITTPDPFLNDHCSYRNVFRSSAEQRMPVIGETPEVDPNDNEIDPVYKVKRGVVYPAFNPNIPWDKMEPLLGMRFESSYQLKMLLTNYGVANGYQLWFMKNDWRCLLAFCGRNVEEGRCAGKKGNKNRVMPSRVKTSLSKGKQGKKGTKKKVVSKKKVVTDSGEGTSQSPRWTKKKLIKESKKVPCPFRLWASLMTNERSFQIKSLIPTHKCCRNYNLGTLVSFKWIAVQYAREIIQDPFMPYRKMKDDIRQKFRIDVSLGQCRRAKQRALFDHEGGLIEHYGKLYEYRKAILDSNPGSTCVLDVIQSSDGSTYFKRMYICFKGVKDGWLAGCRKVIGLDGCFLKHTCRGELLTAMGRDANNQMYPIAWAVVRVENHENWGWFLSLLHDDLSLNNGTGVTIISDSHKGLLDAVHDWLPRAEHRKCTRHVYANFKKKFSGLQFQRLFWAAASSTLQQQFESIMEQIRQIDQSAYDYLIQKNPNSWSRAFFEMDRRCAAFENGISESFNRAILGPRHKLIITMLEEIRLYIMQRLKAMNKIAFSLEDTITPSIRKRLEILRDEQRHWFVYTSSFQLLEVRKGDESYGVNLLHKVCSCRMWFVYASGFPCVHAVAAYMHMNTEIDVGVSHWYSQECWFNAYQFEIKPVFGSNQWKRSREIPPLPPLIRKMPGRPQKARIKAAGENNSTQVIRVGRKMTCTNCWQQGHNKKTCKNDPQPKPTIEKKQPGSKKEPTVTQCTSRGGGTGSRGGGRGGGRSGGSNATGAGMGETSTRGGGTSRRGGGSNATGAGRGETSTRGGGTSRRGGGSSRQGESSRIGESGFLTVEEEYQLQLDEEALREVMEEQARIDEEVAQRYLEQEEWEAKQAEWEARNDYYNIANWTPPGTPTTQQTIIQNNPSQPTQQSSIHGNVQIPSIGDAADGAVGVDDAANGDVGVDDAANGAVGVDDAATDKGKEVAVDTTDADHTQEAIETPKKKRNMQKWMEAAFVNGERIYVKNRGRSERISKQQMSKPYPFDDVGTGSTPDKAFDVSP